MSSIGGILSVARGAIVANQAAMQVTAHNIANAQTEGYSRQVLERAAGAPLPLPYGSLGSGVEITNIIRRRDDFLDAAFRQQTSSAGGFRARADLLGRVEELLNEPSDQGLSAALDAFWNAWSDLATSPANPGARSVVQQRGAQLAGVLNRSAAGLQDLQSNAHAQLVTTVAEINGHLADVAAMNASILAAESPGNQAPDLRDARDRLVDRLAALGIARAEYQQDGTLSVYAGGIAVVSGSHAKTLEVRPGATISIGVTGDPDPLFGTSGTLGSLLQFASGDVPALMAQLDDLARMIVNGVNELHAGGWSAAGDALGGANWDPLNGPTGSRVNFFDGSGTTAATMRLSAEVAADAGTIAAGDVQGAPGNNAVALAMSALRDVSGIDALRTRMGAAFATQIGLPAGASYATFYRGVVTSVGLSVADARRGFETHEALAASAEQRRLSISGVSLDEELTKMMQFQQAYVAATRVVSAVDEMTESLLSMV